MANKRKPHKQHPHASLERTRQQLAWEAARIITESGMDDFRHARHKAATRLGVHDLALLPDHQEIAHALQAHQRLFHHDAAHAQQCYQLREAALQAMAFFRAFAPRLTGAVLEGHVDRHTAVCLHLHCDDPATVPQFLQEHGIPAQSRVRRLRLDRQRTADVDVWSFVAAQSPFELVVLPLAALRQPPLAAGDNQPARRANAAQLQAMLEAQAKENSAA
ncbi:hypothetical protein CO608_05980 [Lysobacteraceae bacterium NML08-0793]|nr:hypothetical protein CO608_05980 [Xanthomonadaceae bacterium NML08-0793]